MLLSQRLLFFSLKGVLRALGYKMIVGKHTTVLSDCHGRFQSQHFIKITETMFQFKCVKLHKKAFLKVKKRDQDGRLVLRRQI